MSSGLKDYADYVNDKISVNMLNSRNYIGVDNILPDKNGVTISNYIPETGSVTSFKKGDILIGNIRPYLKKIWLATFDGGCSADVLCIRSNGAVSSTFLYSVLSQDAFFEFDMMGSKGSKMPRGDKKHIMNFPISNIDNSYEIGNLTSSILKKIENNNHIINALDDLAMSVYEQWFVKFEFPNGNGKPYKHNNGRMEYSEDIKKNIPYGWKVKKLEDIIIENPKSTIKVSDVTDNGDIPFFTSGERILKTNKSMVSGMNIFLNTGGQADVKSYFGEAAYSTDTWCIKSENNLNYILSFFLKKIKASIDHNFFQGTGLKHLQKESLKKIFIIVPDDYRIKLFSSFAENVFKQKSILIKDNEYLSNVRDEIIVSLVNK